MIVEVSKELGTRGNLKSIERLLQKESYCHGKMHIYDHCKEVARVCGEFSPELSILGWLHELYMSGIVNHSTVQKCHGTEVSDALKGFKRVMENTQLGRKEEDYVSQATRVLLLAELQVLLPVVMIVSPRNARIVVSRFREQRGYSWSKNARIATEISVLSDAVNDYCENVVGNTKDGERRTSSGLPYTLGGFRYWMKLLKGSSSKEVLFLSGLIDRAIAGVSTKVEIEEKEFLNEIYRASLIRN